LAFNEAVANGKLKGPVVISRDHHDVGGADSPYRETSNITDGSSFTADMAVHTFVGNAFRGGTFMQLPTVTEESTATWIALHNGGGTGWGEAINTGFGMVLDGTPEAAARIRSMLEWDVLNGVTRRAWSMNQNAEETITAAMQLNPNLSVTLPNHADPSLLDSVCANFKK
jgi:urocanate hydratase